MKSRKHWWGIGLTAFWVACFCLTTAQMASAQGTMAEIQNLTRGKLWEAFMANGRQGRGDEARTFTNPTLCYPGQHTSDNGDWPWGGSIYNTIVNFQQVRNNCAAGEGYWILVKEGSGEADYTVSMVNFRKETADIVTMIYDPSKGPERDLGIEDLSPAGAHKSTYWPGVTEIPEGPVEIHNYAYGRYILNDTVPEEMIIQQVTTGRGITMTKKAYAWSYPDYDDFFIVEATLTNTGDTDGDGIPDSGLPVTLPEVYYVVQTNFAVSEGGAFTLHGYGGSARATDYGRLTLDDWFRFTGAPNYGGPTAYVGKDVSYAYDGDYPLTPDDDTGDPLDASQFDVASLGRLGPGGTLGSYQYIGVAPLATADGGPHPFNTNDAGMYVQPGHPRPIQHYFEIRSFVDYDEPDVGRHSDKAIYDMLTDPVPDPEPTEIGQVQYASFMAFGPYTLGPNESAKIVLAYVAGSGAPTEDLMAWAVEGDQGTIARGEQAMFDALARAQFAYDNGYDVPDAPPDVEVTVVSNEEGNNELSWSDAAESAINPDYGVADVAGYRVYRSTVRQIGPWELLQKIPKGTTAGNATYSGGTYTYKDVNSAAGFRYFYSVRTYTTGHEDWAGGTKTLGDLPADQQTRIKRGLESGSSAPEQWTYIPQVPYVPSTENKDRLAEKVRVVPNPYKLDKVHAYSSTGIRFVNIPRKCVIYVYTADGDIIAILKHDDPTRGEYMWDLRSRAVGSLKKTSVGASAPPGVYYFSVESLVPGSEGTIATGAFMIIG